MYYLKIIELRSLLTKLVKKLMSFPRHCRKNVQSDFDSTPK